MSLFAEATMAAINAMLKVIAVLALGIASAHFQFLTTSFVPQLSGWVFTILLPCMVLANLGRQLSIEKLGLFWPLLLWAIYTIALGYLVGWIYCKIFKPPKEYQPTLLSTVAYNNSLSLPIVVMDSLCASTIFAADPTGAIEAFQTASSLCFVISIPWNLIMFIVGYPHLLELSAKDDDQKEDDRENSTIDGDQSTNLDGLNSAGTELSPIAFPNKTLAIASDQDDIDSIAYNRIRDELGNNSSGSTHPLDCDIDNDPKYPPPTLMSCCASFTDKLNHINSLAADAISKHLLSKLPPNARFVIVMMFTNPPLLAIFLSFFVLIPPIKSTFYSTTGALHFVVKALDFVAQASIPLSTLVTAANIYHSINRNFGRDARGLQRILDVVRVTHDEMAAHGPDYDLDLEQQQNQSQRLVQPPPQQQRNQEDPFSLTTSSSVDGRDQDGMNYMFRQPSILQAALQKEYELSHASHQTTSSRVDYDNNNIRSNSTHSLPTTAPNPHLLEIYSDVTTKNRFLPPISATMGSTGYNDMEQLQRNYSTTDPRALSPLNPKLAELTSRAKPAQPTAMTRLFERIDPNLPIDFDDEGNILPLPRFEWVHMVIISFCRLVIVPGLIYLTFLFIDAVGWTIILPSDRLYRTVILLCAASTTAELVLMVLTKGFKVRQSMALSLVYVVQYLACIITIPIWLVIVISSNEPSVP